MAAARVQPLIIEVAESARRLLGAAIAQCGPGWWIWGLRALILVLVTVLAYQLAELTLFFAAPEGGPSSAAVEALPASRHGQPSLGEPEFQRLIGYQSFFAGVGATKAAPGPPVVAGAAFVDAHLKGTVVGEQGERYAILVLAEGGGREDVYQVGDEVAPGVTVQQVARGEVVLSGRGGKQALALDQWGDGPAVPESRTVQRVVARNALEAQKRDLNTLARSVDLTPSYQQGQASGLQVTRLQPGSFLMQAGLSQGDVIRAVNGHPVGSMDDLMALYRQLEGISDIQVDVLRKGAPLTLQLAIR